VAHPYICRCAFVQVIKFITRWVLGVVKVGVASDTHDDYRAIYRAGEVFRNAGVSAVLHAGDWTSPFSMLKMRRAVGPGVPIYTVFGNNDGDRYMAAVRSRDVAVEVLGEAALLRLGGRRIGLYHGTAEVLLESMARSGMFDVVIYGHTHRLDIRRVNGTLMLNPGEACGCATERKTVAILDLETLEVDVVEL
jgi:putative phosphoesterase